MLSSSTPVITEAPTDCLSTNGNLANPDIPLPLGICGLVLVQGTQAFLTCASRKSIETGKEPLPFAKVGR
jgi:hypothetical protein